MVSGVGDVLRVPDLNEVIFPTAYKAGARVHSDSWGSSFHYSYTHNSQDVDRYTRDHPDFLVVMAAGNYGASGERTVITPADAKNGVCV